MSLLPSEFQFSQASLQDFVDCRRRFYLRYIQNLSWPTIETEPASKFERQIELGERFHRMVHQHILGVPETSLTQSATEPELHDWWQAYLSHHPDDLPATRYPETVLSAPLGDRRLVAKYDLLAIDPGGRAVIVDWKTGVRPSRRDWLEKRMQTRVYRYLLVEAGAQLNGGEPIEAEQVEMIYWYAQAPEQPYHFPYDGSQHKNDREEFTGIVRRIGRLNEEADFPLTTDEFHCRFCTYRSLCDRGEGAGSMDDLESIDFERETFDLDLDFDQIMEIEL